MRASVPPELSPSPSRAARGSLPLPQAGEGIWLRARASPRVVSWALVAPAALFILAFYMYPLCQVLWISVTDPAPGLANYERLFTSAGVQRVLLTTARICVLTTLVSLGLGYLVAYAMSQASPRQLRLMMVFVVVPFWVSVLVRAFAWVTLLRSEGIVNGALLAAGIVDAPLTLVRNELGVCIGMIHYMVPFAVLPLYANMRGIDARYVAAARGLGASAAQAFFRIFLPLSLPGIVGAGILVFIFSLGFYITPAILGGGKTLMMAEYIALQITTTLRWGLGAMLASTLLFSVFVLLAALARMVSLRKLFGAA